MKKIRIKKRKNKKILKPKTINKNATIEKFLNYAKGKDKDTEHCIRKEIDRIKYMYYWQEKLKKLAEYYKVDIVYYERKKRR